MSPVNVCEQAIEAASSLKETVTELLSCYEKLPKAIDAEKDAVRSGEFSRIDAACRAKQEVGDRIEELAGMLLPVFERVPYLHERAGTGLVPKCSGLGECVAALEQLGKCLSQDNMAGKILMHQLSGLGQMVERFRATVTRVKPLLEANKLLMGELLHNYQQSYMFWQGVTEEEASAYNASGTREAKGRHSGFVVKA